MNSAILKTIVKGLLIPISMWMFIGCSHTHTPPVIEPPLEMPSLTAPKDESHVHIVRWAGETLSVISQWYTGSHRNWKAVAKANPDIKPKIILQGDEILIPADLLKTNEPMPQKYLYTSLSKIKSYPSSRVKPSVESNNIELFEPQGKEKPETRSNEIDIIETQVSEQPAPGIEEIELFGLQDKEKPEIKTEEIEFEPQVTKQMTAGLEKVELIEPQDKEKQSTGSGELEFFEPQVTNQPAAELEEIELFGPQDNMERPEIETDEIELFER